MVEENCRRGASIRTYLLLAMPVLVVLVAAVLESLPRHDGFQFPPISEQTSPENLTRMREHLNVIASLLAVDPADLTDARVRPSGDIAYFDHYSQLEEPALPLAFRFASSVPAPLPPSICVSLDRLPPVVWCDPVAGPLPENPATAMEALEAVREYLKRVVPEALPIHPNTMVAQRPEGWCFHVPFHHEGIRYSGSGVEVTVGYREARILSVCPFPAPSETPSVLEPRITEHEAQEIALRGYGNFLRVRWRWDEPAGGIRPKGERRPVLPMRRGVPMELHPMSMGHPSLWIVQGHLWDWIEDTYGSPYPSYPSSSLSKPRLCWTVRLRTLDEHRCLINVYVDAINGGILRAVVFGTRRDEAPPTVPPHIFAKDIDASTRFLVDPATL